jgi:hypothetical protein
MNAEKTSTGLHWILFFVSTAVLIAMLLFMPQWFWLVLPFSCTFLVQAMDLM